MTETAEHLRGLELARSGRIDEAASVFRALLDADADDPEALHFFAIVEGRKQNFAKAERLLKRAVAARPDWAKGWVSLGRVYQSTGRMADAAAGYRQAVRCDPADAQLHCDLAFVLRELGELEQAEAALEQAAELAPGSADVHAFLAAIFKDLHKDDEAEAACRRAIGIDPDLAEAYNVLGIALRRQGRYAEAEASHLKALDLNPASGLYRCNLANLLRDAGRLAEAEAECRQAIEYDPTYAESYRQLADLVTIMADDPIFARMGSLLESGKLSLVSRIDLHYALFRALEDQGNYDAALRQLDEGSRLKRSTIDYDDADREELAEQTTAIFNADLLRRHAGDGAPSDAPIFIVGMPRSGTTLVEQILASHSSVTAGGELPVLGGLANAAGFPSAFAEADVETLHRLGSDYLALARPAGADRFTDKMPINFLRIGLIRLILPNARIIHCRRDPVDTCLSCYRQLFSGNAQPWSYDLREIGLEYRRYGRLMDHWRSVVPDAVYDVQYETLIDDQEAETRRLLDYCGLPFEPACLRFHETDRPVQTSSASQVRKPIYRGAQGRWKNYESHLTPLLSVLDA